MVVGGFDWFVGFGVVCDGVCVVVFMFMLVGFGLKVGLVLLYVWLLWVYLEVLSLVLVLMSVVMVNLGIYGIVCFDL